jgi:hypothetical protein
MLELHGRKLQQHSPMLSLNCSQLLLQALVTQLAFLLLPLHGLLLCKQHIVLSTSCIQLLLQL